MNGVNAPIVHPARARKSILITDLLLGRDDFAMRYVSYYRSQSA